MLDMDFFMLNMEMAWTQKNGYRKIMSWTLPRTHIKIYKRTKSGLQMEGGDDDYGFVGSFVG